MTTETGMTGADDHHFFASTEKHPLPYLPCERFVLSFKVRSLTVLPPYKGGIFGSAFGNAFKNAACAMRNTVCASCILKSQCLYVSLYDITRVDLLRDGQATKVYDGETGKLTDFSSGDKTTFMPYTGLNEMVNIGQGAGFGLGFARSIGENKMVKRAMVASVRLRKARPHTEKKG